MLGSGPDDDDLIAMGPEKPPRRPALGAGALGGRARRVISVAIGCAVVAAGAAFAVGRLDTSVPVDPALARLITEVTTVPVTETGTASATSETAGIGSIGGTAVYASGTVYSSLQDASAYASTLLITSPSPTAVRGPALTAGGKPEVLYVGSGYCPFCAAQSWALIVALSRFGQFSGLSTSRSPFFEDVPPVDGWTFYGSSYASRYLAFAADEPYSNVLVSPRANPARARSYRGLQPLTPAARAALSALDKQQGTPFLDFGGRAAQIGSDVSPYALASATWNQIAAGLRHPRSPAALTIIAAANALTTELCRLTGDRPAAACPKA